MSTDHRHVTNEGVMYWTSCFHIWPWTVTLTYPHSPCSLHTILWRWTFVSSYIEFLQLMKELWTGQDVLSCFTSRSVTLTLNLAKWFGHMYYTKLIEVIPLKMTKYCFGQICCLPRVIIYVPSLKIWDCCQSQCITAPFQLVDLLFHMSLHCSVSYDIFR